MSLRSALERFGRESVDVVYPEVGTALEVVKTPEAQLTPGQSAERIAALGFGVLNTLDKGLIKTVPSTVSHAHRISFTAATRLYLGTMAEIASGPRERNSDLAAELIHLSQEDNLQAVVDEAVKSTVRNRLNEETPGQAIIDAAQRFPFLLMLSSEIDLHHAETASSPDERDGFQQALFSSVSAFDALATQQAQ